MTYQTVSIKETRESLSELIDRAAIGGEVFVVTKFGKAKAAISPLSLLQTRKLGDRERVLERTSGVWKSRRDIGDPVEWVSASRKRESTRHGKIFS